MRAVVQRVEYAEVKVEGQSVGRIGKGLMTLLAVGENDGQEDLDYMVDKVLGLRIFEDGDGKMNLSLRDIGGELLLVSQFTLYGDVRKGRRPSFSTSARPDLANKLYEAFIDQARQEGIKTEAGVFGADMDVSLLNQGPVTIMLDSEKTF